jgi:type IV secretion system protein VirD4
MPSSSSRSWWAQSCALSRPSPRQAWGKGGSAPLLEYQCDTSSTHGLVFAGAGGFKSTSIAVPTLVRWPHSIITLDPSNELAPMTIAARKKMRRDVIVVSPNDPQSSGFNVLSWIDPETPEADDNVASVVQWIAGDDQIRAGSGDNHFFISQGRALVTCLLSTKPAATSRIASCSSSMRSFA